MIKSGQETCEPKTKWLTNDQHGQNQVTTAHTTGKAFHLSGFAEQKVQILDPLQQLGRMLEDRHIPTIHFGKHTT